jgi:hypothetical protein
VLAFSACQPTNGRLYAAELQGLEGPDRLLLDNVRDLHHVLNHLVARDDSMQRWCSGHQSRRHACRGAKPRIAAVPMIRRTGLWLGYPEMVCRRVDSLRFAFGLIAAEGKECGADVVAKAWHRHFQVCFCWAACYLSL